MKMKNKYNINMDLTRDSLFDKLGLERLREGYMRPDEQSPQERFAYVSSAFASNQEHAQRLYEYSSKHWLSYSTPILSYGKNKKGLPISCYLVKLEDTAESLVETLSEVNRLSMAGGGVGIGINIRSADEKSAGVMAHLKVYDAATNAYKQASRRGSYASYLDISHPDIVQFLDMRKPTGDQNLRCMNLHHGVIISDKFMEIIEKRMNDPHFDDSWELKDPNKSEVSEVVSAMELWIKLLENRVQTGEPFIMFVDNANKDIPKWFKDKGMLNSQTNLCLVGETEIEISQNKDGKDSIKVDLQSFCESYYDKNIWYVKSNKGGIFTWDLITDAGLTGEEEELIEIESPLSNKILCTPNHKIFTKNRGYVVAGELLEDDELLEF